MGTDGFPPLHACGTETVKRAPSKPLDAIVAERHRKTHLTSRSGCDRANGSRLRLLRRRNTGRRRFFLTGVRPFGRHPRRRGLVLTRFCSFAREETLESLGEALELAHGTNTFESNPKRGWRAKSSVFRLYRSSLGNLESRLFSRTLPLKKNRPASARSRAARLWSENLCTPFTRTIRYN